MPEDITDSKKGFVSLRLVMREGNAHKMRGDLSLDVKEKLTRVGRRVLLYVDLTSQIKLMREAWSDFADGASARRRSTAPDKL